MKFLNKLERKFGRYAIHNIMIYIILINGAGMLMTMFYPQSMSLFCWSMRMILKGQVWRIITFILVPFANDPVYFLLYAVLYYSIGQMLERTWGAFRMNVYILTGLLGTILAGILVFAIAGIDMMNMNIGYLTSSLFLALAVAYPDAQFLLFFIVPIKAKWMALFSVVMYIYPIITAVRSYGWMPYGISTLVMTVVSLINFIVYFFSTRDFQKINPREIHRRADFKKKMAPPKASGAARHMCAICKRTEKDHPELEFRYCSKCDGAYEYCSDHLYTHVHVRKNSDDSQKKDS